MLVGLMSVLFYFTAAGIVASRLFHHQGPNHRLSVTVALVAIVLHLFFLAEGVFTDPGQNMSMTNVASMVAWLIALTMTLAAFVIANTILLPVVFGFAGLSVLLTLFVPDTYIMNIDVRPALLVHIALALLAYGCLMIALLYALQVSYINLRLKQKRASLLHSSLPPLMAVEQILFKLLLAGTGLLTLSLLSGFVFLEDMFAKEQAHKTLLSVLAWFAFALTLLGHQHWGWRGRTVVLTTITGSFLLTLAYFGSRFVREVIIG